MSIHKSVDRKGTVQQSEWGTFWKAEKTSFYEVMKIATSSFAQRLAAKFNINATHRILDFGCGPGFLMDSLVNNTKNITGADINPFFIAQAKEKYPHNVFVQINVDIEQTQLTLQAQLQGNQYDFIILLSISQYFPDLHSFERVIKMLSTYLSNGGKIIVADVIDNQTSSYKDALSLLYHCIKRGKLISFIRFMLYVLFSTYSDISRKAKLLAISGKDMNAIANNSALKCDLMKGLTIHPSRNNYILYRD